MSDTPINETTTSTDEVKTSPEESNEVKTPESTDVAEKASEEGQEAEKAKDSEESEKTAKSTEEISDADAEKAAEEIEEAVRKWKVKVDGQELEVDEDELKRGYQKSKAAQKRFQEAAKLKKQADQIIQSLKSAPAKVLEKLGVDVHKFAEDIILEEIELEKLTPEQKKIRELEIKLKEKEEAEKKEKEEREQAEYAKMKEQFETELEGQILDALQDGGLPKNAFTVKRMISYLNRAFDYGYENITPADIIEVVRSDYETELQQILGAYDGDTLLKKIPKEVLHKIREADVKQTKTAANPLKTQSIESPKEKEEPKPRKRKSMSELREWAFSDGKKEW